MGKITPTYNTQPAGGKNLNTSGVQNPVVPEFSAVAPEVKFGSTSFINDLKNDFNALKGAPIASAISIGLSGLSNVQNNSQINDASSYYDLYENLGNTQYSVGDINTLVAEKNAMQFEDAPTWETLYGRKKGDVASSILGGAGQGVLSGMAAGPVGALVGGLFGALTSGVGLVRAKNAAKEEAAKIEAAKQAAIAENERNFQSAVKQTNAMLDLQALANLSAFGGPLQTNGSDWSNGIVTINNGGTHEKNPIGGVPMGIGENGKPNLVEEGEVIYNDYVFTNRFKVPFKLRKKHKLGKDITFAEAVTKIQKESEERPNDPISKRGLDSIMQEFMTAQEEIRERRNSNSNKFACGGKLGKKYDGLGDLPNFLSYYSPMDTFMKSVGAKDYSQVFKASPLDKPVELWTPQDVTKYTNSLSAPLNLSAESTPVYSWKNYIKPVQLSSPTKNDTNVTKTDTAINPRSTWMTYAPIIGQGISALTDILGITNKEDYSNADALIKAANKVQNPSKITYNPTGTYMNYNPMDRLYYANMLNAQSNATRRAVREMANGNRLAAMSGLIGANYASQLELGNLYRQADEYDLAQRMKVAEYNNNINRANAEGFLKAAMANQDAQSKANQLGIQTLANAYQMKNAIKLMADENKSNNISGLLTSLGELGHSNTALNAIDFLLASGTSGPVNNDYLGLLASQPMITKTKSKASNKSVKKKKNNNSIV